jgi:predicted nucleic acid-binding protein
MGVSVLLDTNVVLYSLKGLLKDPLPPTGVLISVITQIELLSYPNLTQVEEAQIQGLLSQLQIVPLSPQVVTETIRLRRTYSLRLPDAVIAATATTELAELWSNDDQLVKVGSLNVHRVGVKLP